MSSVRSDSSPAAEEPRPSAITAVIVTYNRLPLLQEVVAALRAQTRPVDTILIINNGSTDKTGDWLASQTGLTVITQPNSGGAGGFYRGVKEAYQAGADWIWLMDDDTIPEPNALEQLCASPPFADPATGFLSCLALWTDGTPHLMNIQPQEHPQKWLHLAAAHGIITATAASFVGTMVSRAAVKAVGLPLKEMFIWFDDSEYTERITREFRGYIVLPSKVLHKTASNAATPTDRVRPGDVFKHCYGVRNRVMVIWRQPASLVKKCWRSGRLLFTQVGMVLRGRAPAKVIWWCLSGFWFRPRVEHV